MRFWANLLGYQAAWFIAVGFAARGVAWPGILACLGFAAVSWWISPMRRSDLKLVGAALACGLLLDGARVQVSGKATLWAPRGRLQFVIERARPEGRGALLEALERLKKKLADEGLFAAERRRPRSRRSAIPGQIRRAQKWRPI